MIYSIHSSLSSVLVSKMKIGWMDTHAHVMDASLLLQIDDVIKRCIENDVVSVTLICMSIEEIELGIRLQSKYPMLELFGGFHPVDITNDSIENYQKLEEFIINGKIVGIGEIGLDFYWDKQYRDAQIVAFRRQCELAIKHDVPINIHMRDATQEVYDIIASYKGQLRGIMHCYSGSVEMAKAFINQGFLISLGGILTFKNAKSVIEVAEEIDIEYLLIETDSPYLTPHPYRGKLNEPSYVALVGEKLASIKNMEHFTIQTQMQKNYKRLFK